MALVFKPVTTLKKLVEIEIPSDFDSTIKADIEVEFKRLGVSQARKLFETLQSKKADEEKILLENIVNIDGIKDEEDNDVPFDKKLLKQLLEESYIRTALSLAFMNVNYNLDKLRTKN